MQNPDDVFSSGSEPVSHSAKGTNQTAMRAGNERLLLTLLRRNGHIAKAEIARQTDLSAQTVARLIRSLEADGLILHGTPQRGRVGQPSVPLSLNPDGAYFLGMKVGRRSVEIVLTDFLGRIIDRARKIHDYPDFDRVLAFATTSIDEIQQRLGPVKRFRVAGLGIAMPFHLWNWAALIGVEPERMLSWKTSDLGQRLDEATGLPTFVQNDATSASSAELVFGKTKLPPNVLCFYLAFFVGGGLILRGSLYTGSTGNAAGLGPLRVSDQTGKLVPLIDLASLATLERSLIDEGYDPGPLWAQTDHWDIPRHILEHWLEQAASGLASAIQSAQTLVDVDAILVDGWLPDSVRTELRDRIEANIRSIDMTGMTRPSILAGSVGADARALGAASLPLKARFLAD